MCLYVIQSVDVETANLNSYEMAFLEHCRSSLKEIEEKLAIIKKQTAKTDTEKLKCKVSDTIPTISSKKVTPGPRQLKYTKLLQYGTNLTGKHHQQQAEGGVQEISHCSSNQKSEAVSTRSAHVAVTSYDN